MRAGARSAWSGEAPLRAALEVRMLILQIDICGSRVEDAYVYYIAVVAVNEDDIEHTTCCDAMP